MQISPQAPRPTFNLSGITGNLLVADDDPDQREFLAEALRACGYVVREAEHGQEALDACSQQPPDAALLDVLMPGMDGIEVCRRLKADPATTHIPVLLVTSLSDRQDRLRGIEAGAHDFISKPVDVQEVSFRVRNSIYIKRLYDRLLDDNTKLRGIEALRDSLTHLVVHDMREPLERIAQSIDPLLRDPSRSAGTGQREALQVVAGSTATLNVLSQSLLDFNRLQMQVLRLCREPGDLAALIRRARDLLQPVVAARGVTLDAATATARLHADQDMLYRVLFILIWNALKHAPDRTAVTVTCAADPDSVRIDIVDRGAPIPDAYRDFVFDMQRQSRLLAVGQGRSAGPGLAYCRLAIQAHGGDIGCGSDAAGTRFWFTIPAART